MEGDAQMTFESEAEIALREGMRRNRQMTNSLLSGAKINVNLRPEEYPSETARQICEELLPRWVSQFLEKNAGYGDMADELGPAAQFVDIHRKVGKLKRALWDQKDIGHEDAEEVAQDLIGHCFLLLRQLRPRYAVREATDGEE